jgi:hypothetical protein
MNKLAVIFIFLFFTSCIKKEYFADSIKTDSVEIVKIYDKKTGYAVTVQDTIWIRHLFELMNTGKKDLIKFYPNYEILFFCRNKQHEILLNKNCIKYERYTYKCKYDIEEYLKIKLNDKDFNLK